MANIVILTSTAGTAEQTSQILDDAFNLVAMGSKPQNTYAIMLSLSLSPSFTQCPAHIGPEDELLLLPHFQGTIAQMRPRVDQHLGHMKS